MSTLLFANSDEWVKIEGTKATIGISNYAQESLGAIVFIELPKVGQEIKKGQVFGAVESVKAASDLYAPISGKVTSVNSLLDTQPELLNEDAYANYLIEIEIAKPIETSDLMDESDYLASRH
jgi:glycine cleavage system H protein